MKCEQRINTNLYTVKLAIWLKIDVKRENTSQFIMSPNV